MARELGSGAKDNAFGVEVDGGAAECVMSTIVPLAHVRVKWPGARRTRIRLWVFYDALRTGRKEERERTHRRQPSFHSTIHCATRRPFPFVCSLQQFLFLVEMCTG